MTSTAHSTTIQPVTGGYLATCTCGWRAAFPSFSEHVARGHAVRHYLATGGSDDDDSRELGTAAPTALALLTTADIRDELHRRGMSDADVAAEVGVTAQEVAELT